MADDQTIPDDWADGRRRATEVYRRYWRQAVGLPALASARTEPLTEPDDLDD
ncbi:MAG TPA: hypothetical protein VGH15_05760 [Caulobacteraceae bacterium]|jgi:hypothetical protein